VRGTQHCPAGAPATDCRKQVWPLGQVPQLPPQPSSPQVLPAHCGAQQLPWWQTWPPRQAAQAAPPAPQAASLVPAGQAPLAAQQPGQAPGPHGGGTVVVVVVVGGGGVVVVVVVAGAQAPFWQTKPTCSQGRQTWSAPQTWQMVPQSATVQQPPG